MKIEELNNFDVGLPDNYNEGLVICDIYTTWCGPCKFLSPVLEKFEQEGLIKLIKVDLEQNRPLGERFNVHSIPTLLFFKNGLLLEGIVVLNGEKAIENGKMIGNWGERNLRDAISQLT
jgi:thioredoxin 1